MFCSAGDRLSAIACASQPSAGGAIGLQPRLMLALGPDALSTFGDASMRSSRI
jgi:hypothetical protein